MWYIGHSYSVTDDCSAINFVLKIVQDLSLCSLSCMKFIDICQRFDNQEIKACMLLNCYKWHMIISVIIIIASSSQCISHLTFLCHKTQCSVHAWFVALLWKLGQMSSHSANYTGWPKKNATLTINNFKKTREKMKKLCALLRIEFFSQQNDTKIINFDEGVLILWPFFLGNVIFKICHFCLNSHNWRTANFHCLAPPGRVFALAL